MDLFKLENAYCEVEIGEVVEVDYESVKILSIVKVDFKNRTIWFNGVLNEKMF